MVVANGQAISLGGYLCSASPAEVALVEATLALTRANVLDPAFDADKADESQSDANDGPINRLS